MSYVVCFSRSQLSNHWSLSDGVGCRCRCNGPTLFHSEEPKSDGDAVGVSRPMFIDDVN
jgi:hypothetical protein